MNVRLIGRCLATLAAFTVMSAFAVTWSGPLPSLVQSQVAAADITYIYDALGRLVGVVDPGGDTAVYQYDAVGNLLSISRRSSALVAIIDFTPGSGSTGTAVAISGTGFSPISTQNTVTFNGTPAAVSSSTTTQIVTSVPAGASTGPLAVTTPSGSATSAVSFTVTNSMAPTITSFTPVIGTPGTAVSITGTNFESAVTNNRLNFNVARAAVGAATSTTLGTTVPNGATSGHLTVATPAGVAQSTADFFMPPPGFTAADVVATGRIFMGGNSLTVNLTPANKIGLVVFDGTAGTPVSLGVVWAGSWDADVTIFRPDGAVVMTQELFVAHDLHIPALPVTGTYTILIKIRSTSATDSYTLTLSQDLSPVAIAIGGDPVTLTIVRAAQRTPLTFSGTAGQRVSVALTAMTVNAKVTVLNPDGSTLVTSGTFGAPSGALDLPVLPATGSYTIFVDPFNAGTGSVTVTLSEEVTGSIATGGASVPLSLARPGQRARLTFNGTAGQRLALGLTASTIGSGTASILKPDGTTLVSAAFATTNTAIDTPPLATTGTYTVLIDPTTTYTGNITLTLSEELAGTITPGGAAVPVNVTRPGQRARLSFAGTAGQRVSVGLTGVTITQYTVSVIKPDGSTLGSTGTTFLDPQTLPTSGTYAVLLDPGQAYTGNATVTLYDVPADITGSVTVNGGAVHVTLTVPGQQAFLTFPGTTGQVVTVSGANSTIGCLNMFLNNPTSGYSVISPCTASFSMHPTLTQTGTYTIRVDPSGANVGSVDVSVTSP